jgi:hypothetical protein
LVSASGPVSQYCRPPCPPVVSHQHLLQRAGRDVALQHGGPAQVTGQVEDLLAVGERFPAAEGDEVRRPYAVEDTGQRGRHAPRLGTNEVGS